MKNEIENCLVDTESLAWTPLIENGEHYHGVFIKSLLYNEEKGRSTTIMVKYEAGASYPCHNHPAGEEVFVLEGEVFFDETKLSLGNYFYTPPNCTHAVRSEKGCTLLFIVPEEVEIL